MKRSNIGYAIVAILVVFITLISYNVAVYGV